MAVHGLPAPRDRVGRTLRLTATLFRPALQFALRQMLMKTYSVLYAQDVPHYATVEIEATTPLERAHAESRLRLPGVRAETGRVAGCWNRVVTRPMACVRMLTWLGLE